MSPHTWNTRHKDGFNSDYYPAQSPTRFQVKKKLLKNIPVATFVAVDKDKNLYALSLNGKETNHNRLWSFDKNGKQRWASDVSLPSLTSIGLSNDGFLYVADGQQLHKLRTKDGSIIWQQKLQEETSAIMFLSEEEILILGIKGNLYLFHAAGQSISPPHSIKAKVLEKGVDHSYMPKKNKHHELLKKGLEQINVSLDYSQRAAERFLGIGVAAKNVLAIDQADRTIYILSADETGKKSKLICLRHDLKKQSYTTVFTTVIGSGCDSSPNLSFDKKSVYCTDKGGKLYAIDAKKGTIHWSLQLENSSSASINSTPDKLIYVSIKENIVCIKDDGNIGTLLWKSELEKKAKKLKLPNVFVNSVLCITTNHVHAITSFGKHWSGLPLLFKHQLMTFDRLTGQLLSSLAIDHECICTPSILDSENFIVPSKPFFQGSLAVLRKKNFLFKLLLPKPKAFHGLVIYTNAVEQ
jgi:outer membrane protein assembly factor BamB